MHEAGFHHPDLFARHILVGQADGLDRICLIDWQRTRRLAPVPWSRRLVDLATLDASLADDVVAPRDRLRLLTSYLHRVRGWCPGLRELMAAVRSRALAAPQATPHSSATPGQPRHPRQPHSWHDWHNCPVRLDGAQSRRLASS